MERRMCWHGKKNKKRQALQAFDAAGIAPLRDNAPCDAACIAPLRDNAPCSLQFLECPLSVVLHVRVGVLLKLCQRRFYDRGCLRS